MRANVTIPSQIQSPRNCAIDIHTHSPGSGWDRPLNEKADSEKTLIVAFAHPSYSENSAILDEVRSTYPQSHLIGCSAVGIIRDRELREDGLVLATMQFGETRLRSAAARLSETTDSRAAGQAIGRQLSGPDLRAVFVLSDGLHVNGSHLARGIAEMIPGGAIVSGGLAGDGARFKHTWVLCGGRAIERGVVAVGFYGSALCVGHASQGGWDVFGPTRTITRSEANVLYELDGKPALSLYKQYLGERAAELPSSALLFPLTIFPNGDSTRGLVRTVLAVDEGAQSMTFAGDMPSGVSAQLMHANFDRLVTAAGKAGAATAQLLGVSRREPALTLAVSCIGRRLILGERTEEELDATCESQRHGDRQIGFYSYGEISPASNGECELHNQTMTLTALSE